MLPSFLYSATHISAKFIQASKNQDNLAMKVNNCTLLVGKSPELIKLSSNSKKDQKSS